MQHSPSPASSSSFSSPSTLHFAVDRRLRYLITMHRLVASVTLSPHVADVVTEAMKGMFTHWMMPTLPAGCNNTCWEGAALQGK